MKDEENLMGSMSVSHWLIVLVVVMLIFGTKKLGNMGADVGKAIKGFKDGVKGDEDKANLDENALQQLPQTADRTSVDLETLDKNLS